MTNRNWREGRVKTMLRVLTALCCIALLVTSVPAGADDGFSTSYTYTYDYWEDEQESPDAYRVSTVINTMSLGLDKLDNLRISKPQSLFVQGNDLYLCDTGNNRILEIRRNGSSFAMSRIISKAVGSAADYQLAEDVDQKTNAYEAIISQIDATTKELEKQEAELQEMKDFLPDEPLTEEENAKREEEIKEKEQAIQDIKDLLEQLPAQRDQAYEAALAAEQTARDGGCRIWRYEAWQKDESGEVVSVLNSPSDITVDDQGNMYIADTLNQRIVKVDKDGNLLREFVKPLDSTFDQKLDFLPARLVVDVAGRVFALCRNVNKGVIKYEADGTFSGFIGANPVNVSMMDYIWKRFFQTREQRAQTESFVPTEYENIYIDQEGFIYATNTAFSEYDLKWDKAKPIRLLNSLGSDILIKNDRFPPIGDLYWVQGSDSNGPSKFVDITALDNEIYVALDRTRGRLFGYDNQGVLLWAFGTKGNTDGAFNAAVSLEHMGYDLLVLDQLEGSVTVFETTEYGDLIYRASETYSEGDYDRSAELWREVLKMNANYPLAFRGIGRAILRQDEYKKAMDYFQLAHDRKNYGRAFKLYRKEWVEQNIWWIILVLAVLLLVPLIIGRVRRLKGEVIMHERSKIRK